MNQEQIKLILTIKEILEKYYFNDERKLNKLENYYCTTEEDLVSTVMVNDIRLSDVQGLYYEKTRHMINPTTLRNMVRDMLTYLLKNTLCLTDPNGMYWTYMDYHVVDELPVVIEPEEE